MAIEDFRDYTPVSRLLSRSTEFRHRTARYIFIAFAIALLTHLIGIIAFMKSGFFDRKTIRVTPLSALKPYEKPALPKPAPLTLRNAPTLRDLPDATRTDTPPEVPNPDVADKDAKARDRQPKDLPDGAPFSLGELAIREGESDRDQQHEPVGGASALEPRRGGMDDFRKAKDIPMWSKELLLRPEYRGTGGRDGQGEGTKDGTLSESGKRRLGAKDKIHIPPDDLNELATEDEKTGYTRHGKFGFSIGNRGSNLPQLKNQRSVAKDFGDFSFSTIEWEYAPYLYYLRERVKRFWHVPEAFKLGLVSGRVIVQFRIHRDGRLETLDVLSYRDNDVAYQSLVNASRNAIFSADPFRSLPKDFPDEFLEIRGTFYYQILGREEE